MAVIYLMHDQHGCKVATSDAEARYDRSNGWYEYDPSEPEELDNNLNFDFDAKPAPAPVVDETPPPDVVNAIAPRRRSRRLSNAEI